jgi:glycosyltransferase involved in cell wall biosynthesis
VANNLGKDINKCELTALIPAYKESEYITATLLGIAEEFRSAHIQFEILVILDDVPGDQTGARVAEAAERSKEIRVVERKGRRGVGDAVRTGIKEALGETVIIVMGDKSEEPQDIIRLAEKARSYDIVFTNRFMRGKPKAYPYAKYLANRMCNLSAKLLFRIPYSDITNAFKAYRRNTLSDLDLTSKGFEIFLELPVKAMRRAHRTTEVEVEHVVMKNKLAKLSVARDGYKYVYLLFSLLHDFYCH